MLPLYDALYDSDLRHILVAMNGVVHAVTLCTFHRQARRLYSYLGRSY